MTRKAGILSMNKAARPTKETRTPKAPAKLPNDVSAGGLPITWCLALVTDRPSTTAAASSCLLIQALAILSRASTSKTCVKTYQYAAHRHGNDRQHDVLLLWERDVWGATCFVLGEICIFHVVLSVRTQLVLGE